MSTRTPGPAGMTHRRTRPGVGAKVAGRVLGRDPNLDRVAPGSAACAAAASAASDNGRPAASQNCSRTMSSPDHEFRHAVLHLQPGIDLEEIERAVRGAQELGRCGIPKTCRGRDPDRHRMKVTSRGRGRDPGAGASSTSF